VFFSNGTRFVSVEKADGNAGRSSDVFAPGCTAPYLVTSHHAPVILRGPPAMRPTGVENLANPASRLHRQGLAAAGVRWSGPPGSWGSCWGWGLRQVSVSPAAATKANNLAQRLAEARLSRRRPLVLAWPASSRAVLDPLRYLGRPRLFTHRAARRGPMAWCTWTAGGRPDRPDTGWSRDAAKQTIGVLHAPWPRRCALSAGGTSPFTVTAPRPWPDPLPSRRSWHRLLSLSGHKIYGPKGDRALVDRSQPLNLAPATAWGGQGRGPARGIPARSP